jgi:hypothetical protein
VTKLLTDIKLFVNFRWFVKIKVICIRYWRIISKLCTRVLHFSVNERNKYLSLFNYFFDIYLILNFIHINIYCIMDIILLNIQVSLFFFLIIIHILYLNTGWWLLLSSGVSSFLSQDWVTTFKNISRTRIIVIISRY